MCCAILIFCLLTCRSLQTKSLPPSTDAEKPVLGTSGAFTESSTETVNHQLTCLAPVKPSVASVLSPASHATIVAESASKQQLGVCSACDQLCLGE